MNDDQKPIWIALGFAIWVALGEVPILFLNVVTTAFVFVGGWILIVGYTFYRVWQLNTQSLIVNDFGFAKLIAGIFVLGMAGTLLYLGVLTSYSPESDSIIWRIKGAFVGNSLVAVGAVTLTIFGIFVFEQIRTIWNWLKR